MKTKVSISRVHNNQTKQRFRKASERQDITKVHMVWTNGSKKSKRNSQHSIISFKLPKHPEGEREKKFVFLLFVMNLTH